MEIKVDIKVEVIVTIQKIFFYSANHQSTQCTKQNYNQISLPYDKVIAKFQDKKNSNWMIEWISNRCYHYHTRLPPKFKSYIPAKLISRYSQARETRRRSKSKRDYNTVHISYHLLLNLKEKIDTYAPEREYENISDWGTYSVLWDSLSIINY